MDITHRLTKSFETNITDRKSIVSVCLADRRSKGPVKADCRCVIAVVLQADGSRKCMLIAGKDYSCDLSLCHDVHDTELETK